MDWPFDFVYFKVCTQSEKFRNNLIYFIPYFRGLMWKEEFDSSYVGFMKDGAQWLVDNTDIKLVGIDYLSVAADDDLIPAHLVFFEGRICFDG